MVKSINAYLVGQAEASQASEPYKTMNDWYTNNLNSIEKHHLKQAAQVSSWAMVLDIVTLKNLTLSQKHMCLYNSANANYCCNTTSSWHLTLTGGVAAYFTGEATCTTYAGGLTEFPANKVGDWGDHFVIMVQNGTTRSKANAIVYGNRVLTVATASGAQASELAFAVHTYPSPAIVSYSDITTTGNPAANSGMTIGEEVTCDTTKWKEAAGCDGITRWGFGAHTKATTTTDGSVRAYQFLADEQPLNRMAVFGVEKKDVINFVMYDHRVRTTVPQADYGPATSYWGVGTFTYDATTGAASLAAGAATLLALTSLF